jgi:uncharacterized protein YqeY
MPMLDDITTAWKDAMKARDPKKDVLAAMRTEIKNRVINSRSDGGAGEAGISAPDELVLDVLGKMAKQRKESIAEYERGGRADLADKERFELGVIEGYLPAKMDTGAIAAVVSATIAELGASGPKDLGRVMKAVLDKVKGQADGKDVQAAVKAALG